MKLFYDEVINTGRQKELDWARGFAVLFMILVHVKMELPGFPLSDTYSRVIEFLGSPLAAPTFMILLGVGIVYSKNKDPKKQAVRGVKLLILHYILNFTAFGIPSLIRFILTQDTAYCYDILMLTFSVDILAFSGLTFLFFALMQKLKFNHVHIILITLAFSCLNYILTIPVENLWLQPITGLFVCTSEISFFPFLSWIGYPVMGYIFADLLIRCSDKRKFYRILFASSVLITAAVTLGARKYGFDIWSMHFGPGEYYYQDFIQYILVGGICFSWISILFALSEIKGLTIVGKQLARWSKNTTVIYFAQWMIIGWLYIMEPIKFPANIAANLILGIAISILSDVSAILYQKAVDSIRRKRSRILT